MQEICAKREQERLVGHVPMKYFMAWNKQAKISRRLVMIRFIAPSSCCAP
jgi:hypothetical protein